MKKLISIIYPFTDFLYILQLEEYDTLRYLRRLPRFFVRRNVQIRDHLVYTTRVKVVWLLSVPLSLFTPPLVPIWIALANILSTPYFSFVKLRIQKKAQEYFKKTNKHTKVIAIAGSYGKTTTKNYIYELIRFSYKTQMIPGNINTPTGIAIWILKNFDPSSEVLLVEVDTYFIGEIRKSLAITPPDIAVLTNIGDQHLERHGTKALLARALNEVFTYAKPHALHIKDKSSNLEYARAVAYALHVPQDIIKDTEKKLIPPQRRRNLIHVGRFELIDDSYNISESTSISGIEFAKKLATEKHKKLIVITAGIPELGLENRDGNKHLGKILGSVDTVILLQSIFSHEIQTSIGKKVSILHACTMSEALDKLNKFDDKKYLVLMQPELNDLYYDN